MDEQQEEKSAVGAENVAKLRLYVVYKSNLGDRRRSFVVGPGWSAERHELLKPLSGAEEQWTLDFGFFAFDDEQPGTVPVRVGKRRATNALCVDEEILCVKVELPSDCEEQYVFYAYEKVDEEEQEQEQGEEENEDDEDEEGEEEKENEEEEQEKEEDIWQRQGITLAQSTEGTSSWSRTGQSSDYWIYVVDTLDDSEMGNVFVHWSVQRETDDDEESGGDKFGGESSGFQFTHCEADENLMFSLSNEQDEDGCSYEYTSSRMAHMKELSREDSKKIKCKESLDKYIEAASDDIEPDEDISELPANGWHALQFLVGNLNNPTSSGYRRIQQPQTIVERPKDKTRKQKWDKNMGIFKESATIDIQSPPDANTLNLQAQMLSGKDRCTFSNVFIPTDASPPTRLLRRAFLISTTHRVKVKLENTGDTWKTIINQPRRTS